MTTCAGPAPTATPWRVRCRGGVPGRLEDISLICTSRLYPQADEAFRLGLNAGGFDEDRHHFDPAAPLPVDRRSLISARPLRCRRRSGPRGAPDACAKARRDNGLFPPTSLAEAGFMATWKWKPAAAAEDEFTTRVKLTSVKGWHRYFTYRAQSGVRGLCLARPIEGNCGGQCRSRRS